MEKTVDELINETEQKLINAINESHLAPSILILIMRNVTSQLQMLTIQKGTDKGEKDADG